MGSAKLCVAAHEFICVKTDYHQCSYVEDTSIAGVKVRNAAEKVEKLLLKYGIWNAAASKIGTYVTWNTVQCSTSAAAILIPTGITTHQDIV